MKKFNIKVNGKSYEVEVEEIGGASFVPQAPAAGQAASAVTPSETKAASSNAPATSGAKGAIEVKAPMPGTINAINVKVGDTIKKGQVIAILEAMKMENEIMADADATVSSVNVSQGQSVNTGDIIVTLN